MSDKFRCRRPDCAFRARDVGHVYGCNYFFLTGKSRIAQHPEGQRAPAQCKLYIKRGSEKVVVENRRPNEPVWTTLALSMYKQGETDEQIASVLGLKAWQIAHWRKKNNLSRVRGGYGRPRSFDEQKAAELHKQGKTDSEIAAAVNVSRQTISSWRNELGLKINSARTATPRGCKVDWAAAMPLYEKGLTDKQIAAQLGCSHKTVCKWRRKNGLPCKTLKGGENNG